MGEQHQKFENMVHILGYIINNRSKLTPIEPQSRFLDIVTLISSNLSPNELYFE